MARSIFILYSLSRRRVSDQLRSLFFIPTALALTTSLFILFYISSTSNLFTPHPHRPSQSRHHFLQNPDGVSSKVKNLQTPIESQTQSSLDFDSLGRNLGGVDDHGKTAVNEIIFHDQDIFKQDYLKMNKSFKIFMYPHNKNDPFANILLPVDFEPEGNYASESFFKKTLNNSHFLTKDPAKADLFYLPFSIARLRHDPRVGIDGIQDFIKDYIYNVSHYYPYWNRTGGADHFYVSCHSIGRVAINKAEEIKLNAIQVVCSSSYFQSAYVPHKDASLPQIWPRVDDDPPRITSSQRKKLAFFAGSINSPVRQKLVETWQNDTTMSVHAGHLNTSYEEALQDSKFCLHVKGFEVNTARIGDALYHGCVPVIIANHYDLPFADILNWKSFSLVIATLDIPLLQRILRGLSDDEYASLHKNVLEVRKHFRWHVTPVDYDAFYMVMYELWLRRSSIRVPLS
ncbi:putative xylogalacturonan beta-1,3-xylosyltransferase [Helianthus annuus]|nr:putative xylogalacturonan beta-1,3-xylosyltransferase [Helianthus annuus]KAJ0806229.1 putative xylogalacturonan beta-1,3-xylosyltransferase [Helianthus annuus]